MQTYTIGEVAKLMQLPASTIRFYDKHGLLPFVKRDAHGQRQFSENDLNYLDVITVLKKSGVPVDTIAQFIQLCQAGDATLQQRYDYLTKTEAQLAQKVQELQEQQAFLNFKKWYYQQALAAGTEQVNFKPGTHDFDPAVKQRYAATKAAPPAFKKFLKARSLHEAD